MFEWDRERLLITSMRGDNKLEYADVHVYAEEDKKDLTIGEHARNTSVKMLGLRISLQKKENSQDEEENEKNSQDEI